MLSQLGLRYIAIKICTFIVFLTFSTAIFQALLTPQSGRGVNVMSVKPTNNDLMGILKICYFTSDLYTKFFLLLRTRLVSLVCLLNLTKLNELIAYNCNMQFMFQLFSLEGQWRRV